MAVVIGQLPTRVLIATGDADPIEVATITTDLIGTGSGAEVKVSMRSWRRTMALGFLRMAWATATSRSARKS